MMSDSEVKERVMHGWTKAGPGLTIVSNKAYITFFTIHILIFNLTVLDVNVVLGRHLKQLQHYAWPPSWTERG
jgi:hypothetical protein